MTEARRITDPQVLKGLAHPLRRDLLRQLSQFGPATAGVLARRLSADPGQISYHLRELGRSGFIEEAPELARDRRERVWRAVPGPVSWSSQDFTSPEGLAAADAVRAQRITQQFERLAAFNAAAAEWPAPWVAVATDSESYLHLSPGELTALCEELNTVVRRHRAAAQEAAEREREAPGATAEAAGAGREHVFLFFHAFPERPGD